MKIKQFTKPAIKVNEDVVYASEHFGFVIDGATGLLKENITDKPSDAQWFVECLKKFLVEHLANNQLAIKDIVREAIVDVNNKYNSFEGAENVKSKPSAGIAIYRINNNFLEYFILGDCSLLVKQKNKVEHLKLDDLTKLDNINISKMQVLAKQKNINVIDARPLINDDLVKTRLSQNTENGYWIVSDDVNAVDHALQGKLPLENIRQIVGLTDGFSQVFDVFEIYSKESLLDTLCQKQIEDIYEELWKKQEEDKFCNNCPRFKLRDDASVFSVELNWLMYIIYYKFIILSWIYKFTSSKLKNTSEILVFFVVSNLW